MESIEENETTTIGIEGRELVLIAWAEDSHEGVEGRQAYDAETGKSTYVFPTSRTREVRLFDPVSKKLHQVKIELPEPAVRNFFDIAGGPDGDLHFVYMDDQRRKLKYCKFRFADKELVAGHGR
jgi:hypothetical protein